MRKLTVYGKGTKITVCRGKYFVEYDENRNKQITDRIQIEYLKQYFDRNGVNRFFEKRALEFLNEYSKTFNKKLKEKDVLDFDKMNAILKNNGDNGYYDFGTLKEGRKTTHEYYVLSKPLSNELRTTLNKVYRNCMASNKTIYIKK